ARVRPDEPVEAGNRLDDLRHVCVVGVEDNAGADVVSAHQLVDTVAVERDAEHRLERADVHVRVEDHATADFTSASSASAASTPAPMSTVAPRSASVWPTAASPTTG